MNDKPTSGEIGLSSAFLAGLAAPSSLTTTDLEAALSRLVVRAHTAWSTVALADAHFVVAIAERLSGSALTIEALDRLRAEDLFLATACAAGGANALTVFENTYGHHIRAIVSRFDSSTAFRDEVHQLVRHRLFLARPGRAPAIGEYAGKGELLAFVRVVTVRIALDLLRKRKATGEVSDEILGHLPATEDDPELQYLKVLYRSEFKEAFESAIQALPARARTLLRYHFVDRLSIDKIAAIYDLHRSTIARQIARARGGLVSNTRAALKSRLEIDTASFDSIVRLIESNVDLSVERILRAEQS